MRHFKRSEIMGRPKGGTNHYWSTEEKLRIVLRVESGEKSYREIAIEEHVYLSQLKRWVKNYREKGIEGISNKKKPGNPLVRYSRRKTLTELEKLEYENMKLKIENAR
jgi:transposase-like protein